MRFVSQRRGEVVQGEVCGRVNAKIAKFYKNEFIFVQLNITLNNLPTINVIEPIFLKILNKYEQFHS